MHSASITPSNTPYEGDILEENRYLTLNQSARLEKLRDMERVWGEIVDLLVCGSIRRRSLRQHAKELNLESLMQAMKAEYANKVDFNKALFLALREVLTSHNLILPIPKTNNGQVPRNPENYPIVFDFGQNNPSDGTSSYAIGIAREVNGAQKFDDNRKATASDAGTSDGSPSSETSGVSARCKTNHCTCLLKRDNNGQWTVVEVLSVMELTISNEPGFAELKVKAEKSRSCVTYFPLRQCPPMAQVMTYTMDWVLPSHAKIGVLKDTLRWVVVIGKTCAKKDDGTTDKGDDDDATDDDDEREPKKKRAKVASQWTLEKKGAAKYDNKADDNDERDNDELKKKQKFEPRWTRAVAGNIYVPEVCGESFEYAVTGYVRSTNKDLDRSIAQALTLYLETIFFGLEAAKTLDDHQATTCRSQAHIWPTRYVWTHKSLSFEMAGKRHSCNTSKRCY